MTPLFLHPDRAFPADPGVRANARAIYAATRHLPLLCVHGHVDAAMLADDVPFTDPATMLITPDHYVTRLLHAAGVPLEDLGIPAVDPAASAVRPVRPVPPVPPTAPTPAGASGAAVPAVPAGASGAAVPAVPAGASGAAGPPVVAGPVAEPRAVWRVFCAHWKLFRGTPSRYWLTQELVEVFGVDQQPSRENADALFDQISERLAGPEFRPRALFQRFGIELLATTDSPLDDLRHHQKLAGQGWPTVVPTFRPDALVRVDRPGWVADVTALGGLAGVDTGDYAGYLAALRRRRQAFVAAGALATDHGHATADTTPLPDAEASRIYAAALAGTVDEASADAFAGHMLFEMAKMSVEDGLVLQLHPGVLRDHHREVHTRYGPDLGFDIPVAAEFARALRPLLEAYGREPRFRMVVFTVDETTYSRELAPLAGVYPALRLGAPWWFLDSPAGLRRYREAVTETAGFYNTAGFVDDTRAFASIPARHDLARRIDAGYLATLVSEHHLDLDEAIETGVDLAYQIPRDLYARA